MLAWEESQNQKVKQTTRNDFSKGSLMHPLGPNSYMHHYLGLSPHIHEENNGGFRIGTAIMH